MPVNIFVINLTNYYLNFNVGTSIVSLEEVSKPIPLYLEAIVYQLNAIKQVLSPECIQKILFCLIFLINAVTFTVPTTFIIAWFIMIVALVIIFFVQFIVNFNIISNFYSFLQSLFHLLVRGWSHSTHSSCPSVPGTVSQHSHAAHLYAFLDCHISLIITTPFPYKHEHNLEKNR